MTSPEVGSVFGEMVARALDHWWRELSEPDPFVVIEAGAGRGRLAADVLRAAPDCARALRYVLVESSPVLRDAQRELVRIEPVSDVLGPMLPGDDETPARTIAGLGPLATAMDDLPSGHWCGVILANELMDNLPIDIVERGSDRWHEIRVGWDGDRLVEVKLPATQELSSAADRVAAGHEVPSGGRLPVPTVMRTWLETAATRLERGYLCVIDYVATASELVERGQAGWLRTYREHAPGGSALDAPGEQDITCDVPLDALVEDATRFGLSLVQHVSQERWLRSFGIEELTAVARRTWEERAAIGDLTALAARSRVHEADALLDRAGLGGHHVLVFTR